MCYICRVVALTVRYLTGRFIGEYHSGTDMTYQHTVPYLGSWTTTVELLDVSARSQVKMILQIFKFQTSKRHVSIQTYSHVFRAKVTWNLWWLVIEILMNTWGQVSQIVKYLTGDGRRIVQSDGESRCLPHHLFSDGQHFFGGGQGDSVGPAPLGPQAPSGQQSWSGTPASGQLLMTWLVF